MKTIKSKVCLALFCLLCACFGGVAFMRLSPSVLEVYATEYSATDFKMLEKASVRKDARNNGIRFATFIGENSVEAGYDFINDYELGTLFIPKAILGDNQLTVLEQQAVVARFNGDTSKLITDGNYEGGKLFCAVLDLSDYSGVKEAMNGKIVARTYVKNKSTNEIVKYCDAVEFAPAYVSALAIEANEIDNTNTLSSYVQHVEIECDAINLSAWGEPVQVPKTNVEGIPVSYVGLEKAKTYYEGLTELSLELARISDGMIEGLNEGDTSITVSALKGSISKQLPVTVTMPQVAFFSENYKPSEYDFTIRAKNVKEIAVGQTVVPSSDYEYANDIITISKAKLLESAGKSLSQLETDLDLTLNITTTGGVVSTVPVYFREAKEVNFESEDKIGRLVLLDGSLIRFNPGIAEIKTDPNAGSWANSLYLPFEGHSGSDRSQFNLNLEYLKALSATNTSKSVKLYWGVAGSFSNIRVGDFYLGTGKYQLESETKSVNTSLSNSEIKNKSWHDGNFSVRLAPSVDKTITSDLLIRKIALG